MYIDVRQTAQMQSMSHLRYAKTNAVERDLKNYTANDNYKQRMVDKYIATKTAQIPPAGLYVMAKSFGGGNKVSFNAPKQDIKPAAQTGAAKAGAIKNNAPQAGGAAQINANSYFELGNLRDADSKQYQAAMLKFDYSKALDSKGAKAQPKINQTAETEPKEADEKTDKVNATKDDPKNAEKGANKTEKKPASWEETVNKEIQQRVQDMYKQLQKSQQMISKRRSDMTTYLNAIKQGKVRRNSLANITKRTKPRALKMHLI